MSSYQATDRNGRWKAIAAVAAVHALLGAVILSGLNVRLVHQAVERMSTFDVIVPKPPPPPPPPPSKEQPRPKPSSAGAPEKKPSPSPVVVPEPRIPIPTSNPVVAANIAGTGSARSGGGGGNGNGNGNGGAGNGAGNGGGLPARLIRNLTRGDYRAVTGGRLASGSAALALRVDARGQVAGCQLIESSGDPFIDGGLCGLARQRLRFDPARDPSGRPVPYSTNYRAVWRVR
ncbi:hypothetical protein G7078_09370 [Sphingomonas sinipercae]|uniref:Energy transducer TonB n=1 Tax=Sphingomonas sinipercae TaxID=2714944 RepID=A0A6G7ZPQ1_9SPHN|nr:hypothetical protein [Sphingomonas sinipercae]QIL02967.1 hypothetical protein G7078_09370 [Sphingomonas sinipercae]